MIHAVEIHDPAKACVPWWKDVPWLQGKTRIDLSPGLNILWGPNGSGKSTLLRAIARQALCEQGGVPKLTRDGLRALEDHRGAKGRVLLDGVRVETDGDPVYFCDPSDSPGLVGGMAGFDYDFMEDGLVSIQQRRTSHGEQVLAQTGRIMEAWKAGERIDLSGMSDTHWARREGLLFGIEPSPGHRPQGRPTILLDEPTRNVSLPFADRIWWRMLQLSENVQIIVATHCFVGLAMPDGQHPDLPYFVNWVETEAGYRDQSRAVVQKVARAVDRRMAAKQDANEEE